MKSTFTVRIAKLDENRSFEWAKLPDVSKEKAIEYGLTRLHNDANASITRDKFESEDAWKAAVRRSADAVGTKLTSGNWERSSVSPAAALAAEYNMTEAEVRAFLESAKAKNTSKKAA